MWHNTQHYYPFSLFFFLLFSYFYLNSFFLESNRKLEETFFVYIEKHRTYLVGNVSKLYDRRCQLYSFTFMALRVIFVFTCFYFERQIFFQYVLLLCLCFCFHLRPKPCGKSSVACQKCQGQLLYLESHEYLTSVISWQKEERYDVTWEMTCVKV